MQRTGIVLMVVVASILGFPPQFVHAGTCDQEEAVFWAEPNASGTGWKTGAFGTKNEIRLTDRPLNTSCTGNLAGSTAFISLGGVFADWVEVGWEKLSIGSFGWFTEWGLGGVHRDRTEGLFPCSLIPGGFGEWTVNNQSGTNDWHLKLSCKDGTGNHTLKIYTGLPTNKGTPTGETWRFGGTQTGMSDLQRALVWKDSNNVWQNWTNPKCRYDDAAGWKGNRLGNVRYEVIQGVGDCDNR